MLYSALRLVAGTALRWYYREVALVGGERIPRDGPALLVVNHPNALVSLMHANNEIGNLLDIGRVADICQEFNAYFHSDTVQSVGHYRHDMSRLKVHGMTAAAHKFHGPKGFYSQSNKR